MHIGESVDIALTAIRANKMRSALTLLGIIIGVMTIIAMQSLITGLRNSVKNQTSVLGSNVFQVQKFPDFQRGNRRALSQSKRYHSRTCAGHKRTGYSC